MPNQEEVTRLLIEMSEGKQATMNDLLPLVHAHGIVMTLWVAFFSTQVGWLTSLG